MIPLVNVSFISFEGRRRKTQSIIIIKKNQKGRQRDQKVRIPFCHSTGDEKSQKIKKLEENDSTRGTQEQLEIYDNLLFFKRSEVRAKKRKEDVGKLDIIAMLPSKALEITSFVPFYIDLFRDFYFNSLFGLFLLFPLYLRERLINMSHL